LLLVHRECAEAIIQNKEPSSYELWVHVRLLIHASGYCELRALLTVIQELLGHATIMMTMRYAHLAPEIARDAVRLLDAWPTVAKRWQNSGKFS
jgi:integrase